MSWRYMNPGLVSLLDSDVTATQYTGYEYSNTGYAFTQTTEYKGVTLPQMQQSDDFWAKVDMYIPEAQGSSVHIYIPASTNVWFELDFTSDNTVQWEFCVHSPYVRRIFFEGDETLFRLKRNAVNSFAFHAVYGDESTAKAEIFFCGDSYIATGMVINPFYSYATQRLGIHSGKSIKFSNLICSNEEIDPREQVTALLASATETTMATMTGGMYIANSIGQTFLQTPDVSSLITDHGANSTVTSVQVRGNPAYRTGAGLKNMIGLSKSGNTITEHNTIAVGTAVTDFTADTWRLSGVTLGDLQNMQFGWKAAR